MTARPREPGADAIETDERLERVAPEWDALADRVDASPLLRPGWLAAWWSAFGRGSLEILTVRRGGRLAGVLPVYQRGGVWWSTTNVHSAEFAPIAADERAAAGLARGLFSRDGRRVALSFLTSVDATLAPIRRAASEAGWRTLEQPLERSPYIALDGDFAGFESTLDGKLRSELRRRRRRLEEDGPLTVEVADGRGDLDALLDEGLAVESAAWKGESGTAIASQTDTNAFYRGLAAWAAERGFLRLAFLRHGGVPLAFDFSLEGAGAHYLLKTGYAPAYSRAAPGMILRHAMIERAFAAGLGSYEFLGHDHPWKRRWTSTCRERIVFQAFAPSIAGSLDHLSVTRARPLAKRLVRRS